MSGRQRRPQARRPIIPDPGTTLLAGEETVLWTRVAFATGVAPSVRGRRWYRDPDGRDIEQDLERHAGWPHRDGPTGPPELVTPDWRDGAAKATGIGIKAAQIAFWLTVSLAGGPGSGNIAPGEPSKRYMDPATESDDFPVMAASPRSTAAAPWQLDPDRRREHYEVLLTLTTRRLLFTGLLIPGGIWRLQEILTDLPRELLWEVRHEDISNAERRKYSTNEADVIVRFTDGSWLRLYVYSNGTADEIVQALTTS